MLRSSLLVVCLSMSALTACHNVGGVVDDQDGDGVVYSEDCDDLDPSAYPGADELCDGVDNDCDGQIDEDAVDASSWAVDFDGDGYGDMDAAVASCEPVEGTVEDATDCDDTDADINPGVDEIWYDGIDQDCDGASDYDQDADGHDSSSWDGEDCDDTDPAVNPDAEEIWYDGIDQDCDGESDYDQDGDGWSLDWDCDDTDAEVNPGADELWYDGIDQDCDGLSDYDADFDGHDAEAYGGEDCDDTDASIHPGATEVWYDGTDQDCSGGSDYDQDGDGVVSDAYLGEDCDDTDASIHPGATEIWYDGVDQDCDGANDYDQDADGFALAEDCDDEDASVNPGASETWYDGVDQDCDEASDYDQDGDGHDASAFGGTDCDDTDPDTSPGADEHCDGVDNDCDGAVDEQGAVDGSTWYTDADGDGYGDPSSSVRACTQPTGMVADSSDCDDGDATQNHDDADGDGWSSCDGDCDDGDGAVSPGAEEIDGDGVDNDCDGEVDNVMETWVITTVADFELGDVDGNAHITRDGDGELTLAPAATGYSGSSSTTSLPDATSSMGVVAANGYLYAVGGSVTSGYSSYYTDEVAAAPIQADGSLGSWDTSLEELPTATTTVALATDGHCLVVAGGYTSSDSTAEEVYTAELYGDGTIAPWVQQEDLPSGRSYAQAAVLQGYVYLIGGEGRTSSYSTDPQDDVYYAKLGPDCGISGWASTSSLPSARSSHAVTTAGGHLYVLGGDTSSGTSSRVYRAILGNNGMVTSWSTESSMPDSRYGHGAVAVDGYIIVGGGRDSYYDYDDTYYGVIEDDGSISGWGTGTASLSGDRYYLGLVAWDGNLYQVAGRNSYGRSSHVERFAFTESGSVSALQTGFGYVFDFGANTDLVELDWTQTAPSDGTVSAWYRGTTNGGSPGAWIALGSAPAALAGRYRYVELWLELESASGDFSSIDEIVLGYLP